MNREMRLVCAVGFLGSLLHVGFVLFAPIGFLERYSIVDDTFYYWMIARRYWTAGFYTFDGINPTNGFQPLWQWMLLPLGLLEKDIQLRLSVLLGALLYQAAAWLLALWKVADDRLRIAFRIGAVLLWVNARFVFEYSSSGMEFGLYLFVAAWAVAETVNLHDRLLHNELMRSRSLDSGDIRGVMKRDFSAGWITYMQSGRWALSLALLPLARVDGIGLAGLLWLALIWKVPNRSKFDVLVQGLCIPLLFFVYLAWNHATFDSILPISGTVKRLDRMNMLKEQAIEIGSVKWMMIGIADTGKLIAGNVLRFFSGWLPPGNWSRWEVVAVGGLTAAAIVVFGVRSLIVDRKHRSANHRPHFALIALLLFIPAQALVYSFVIPGGTHYAQWYYGPVYLALALGSGWLLSRLWRPVFFKTAFVLLALQIAAITILPQPSQIPTEGVSETMEFLDSLNLDEGTQVGSWNAGIVAFRAPDHLHVVNLDGLVNSTEYARKWAVGVDKREYLREREIAYLVDYGIGREEDSWKTITNERLYSRDPEAWRSFIPLYIGPPPAQDSPEPRRYYVLQAAPEVTGAERSEH